jgi:predicted permease
VTSRDEPPRFARWLLARALPDDARDHIAGDLLELYGRRCAHDGVARARLWYWMEAASFSSRFLFERFLARRPRSRIAWGRTGPSLLDVRLAVRLLVKFPGLTLVAVTGMAAAIAIGAGVFSLSASLLDSALPLPGGDRVVALRNAILTEPGRNQASLRDFVAWRDDLKSVHDLSAFTIARRTLVVPGADVDLVRVARMTASGFRIAPTTPHLGRTLLEDDERNDARVVVIAFDEWQRRFASDPAIIGQRISLGNDVYTIVGVMPAGFRFPVADRYWVPLHFGLAERARPDDVSLTVFGRLAEGASFERAQAELDVIGSRMATTSPRTHGHLRPRVLPYTRAFFDIDSPAVVWQLYLFRFFVSLLLVAVAVNVATLVYARTATRVGEIAVRTALGASRARVVTQLFVEALALSLTGALVGLGIAGAALGKLRELAHQALIQGRLGEVPFWVDLELSPEAITYALVLAIAGAAIVGVAPALQATGRHVQTGLQRFSGQGGRMQLGRAWTTLIIAQVAVAVAVLPFGVHFAQEVIASGSSDPGYPAEEFLEATLTIERAAGVQDTSAAARRAIEARFRAGAAELLGRLESDPAVAGLTIEFNRTYERMEIEATASPADQRPAIAGRKRINRVEPDYFALYGLPIVVGRDFVAGDAGDGGTAVIVNQVFAENFFGSGAVLGRRLRFVDESETAGNVETGPWLEVVGVVRDFQAHAYEPQGWIYLPADIARLSPPTKLAIRVRVNPATILAPRLRELAAAVDPMLQVDDLVTAAERHRQNEQLSRYVGFGTTAVMLSALLLSAAGIYALMSFTVARRRREIGIRSALGADPRRVLSSIFARASANIGAGILLGMIGTVAVDRLAGKGPVRDGNLVALLVVAGLMTIIGLLAAVGPARRGLAVHPSEALRAE